MRPKTQIRRVLMKEKFIYVLIVLLMISTHSSADIRLERKSTVSPNQSKTLIAFPQFAVNTQNGETLIVWVGWGTPGGDPILGRIVNAQGKTVGKIFRIVTL